MGVNIHVPADEVWSFFQKNKDRLEKEMVAIAENDDTDYAVYLTEDYGYPTFFVCKGDDEPEYEEGAISADDCLKTARKCYSQYLFPVSVCSQKSFQEDDDNDENETEDSAQEMQDLVYEREDELRMALCDFLQVVLLDDEENSDIESTYGSAMIDEILDHFLEYLGFEHSLPVYRPMFVADDDAGCEVYTEFPYDMEGIYENDETGGWSM
jgi:hypothetical protein|nr:MAG TPA: hypothetical protein [Caudoviricetes sp.]